MLGGRIAAGVVGVPSWLASSAVLERGHSFGTVPYGRFRVVVVVINTLALHGVKFETTDVIEATCATRSASGQMAGRRAPAYSRAV